VVTILSISILISWIGVDFRTCFRKLKRSTPGITQAMLSSQLQELGPDGIASKHEYTEVPPRTEYSITDLARRLIPVITAMEQWGVHHLLDHQKTEHGDCLWTESASEHA
jgi:DNA-binding HxlR family transcriptional regulator